MRTRCKHLLALVIVGGFALGWLPSGPPEVEAATRKKLAMVLPGSIQDADWNTVGYLALQEVAKAYDVQVSHSENVAVADAERVTREYINAGYDMVAYHGAQFTTIPLKLAPQFPQATFIQETAGPLPNAPANVWAMGRKWFKGFYVLGTIAALSTKTNKIGYIGGVRIPDSVAVVNVILQAIREHNPAAQLIHTHVGDFNDPVKARQTAEAQINAGVDFIVIFVNLGVYGVAEAVKASGKPVLFTTFHTDKPDLAPKNLVVSLTSHFGTPYKEVVGRILKGERTGYYEVRPGAGMELSDVRNVPSEVAAKAKVIFKEVVAGKPIPEITDRVVEK